MKPKVRKQLLAFAAVVVVITAGAAFAILQSQAKLTGNTISTASAGLLLSTDGVNYSQSVPGFNFQNIIPGGWPAPAGGYQIYLKNTGNTPLGLQLGIGSALSNPGSADLSKINIGLTDTSGNTAPRGFVLSSLINSNQSVEGDLAPGAVRQYKLQALAANDATPGATVNNIDLAFVGTPRDPNEPAQ